MWDPCGAGGALPPEVSAALSEAGHQPLSRSVGEELLLAAEQGDHARLAALLSEGAPPDTRDSRTATKGWTPLMLSVARGHKGCAEALLAAGASLEVSEEGDAGKARMLASETLSRRWTAHRPWCTLLMDIIER